MMADFNTNALLLSIMTDCFYYPYVLMQIPVGLLVDRFGAKRLLAVMSLLTSVGCVCLAMSPYLSLACLSRILIGFAASFAFVGAIRLSAMWHPSSRIGLIVGMTQASGMLGAAVGDAPVAYLVQHVGWRLTLVFMGTSLCILALLITFIVREKYPSQKSQSKEAFRNIWENLMVVLRNPQSWSNALYAGLVFAPVAVFAEVWGVAYLQQVNGLSKSMAAFANSMIFIGWAIGGPIISSLSDALRLRKPIMIASATLCFVFFTVILIWHQMPYALLVVLLFLFGFVNTGVAISYTVATEINPRQVTGTSLAFANMASVIIGTLMLPLLGFILDWHGAMEYVDGFPVYSIAAFKWSMAALPIILLMAIAITFKIRETHCQNLKEASP